MTKTSTIFFTLNSLSTEENYIGDLDEYLLENEFDDVKDYLNSIKTEVREEILSRIDNFITPFQD